jgi:hypothetical protein
MRDDALRFAFYDEPVLRDRRRERSQGAPDVPADLMPRNATMPDSWQGETR